MSEIKPLTVNPLNTPNTKIPKNTEKKATRNEANLPSANVKSNPEVVYDKEKNVEKNVNYTVDTKQIHQLKKEHDEQTEAFRRFIISLIEKQGYEVKWVLDKIEKGEEVFIEISEEDRLAAEAAIGPDGFWGAENTANRILEFARSISGGDPSKAEWLRQAVKEGFEAAKELLGGELPEVSQRTYELVMKGFDEWEK